MAFRNVFTLFDLGLEKRNNMARISLVFGSTLGTILRAELLHREFAKNRHLYITVKPVNLLQTDYSTSQLPVSYDYLHLAPQYPKVYNG